MSITRIKASNFAQSLSASCNSSFNTLPTAGHTIVVMAWSWTASTAGVGTCTDNQGNTYTLITSKVDGSGSKLSVAIWGCLSIGTPSGTFTVTPHFNTGTAITLGVAVEFSGVTSITADATASNLGTSASASTGTSGVTSVADSVVLAVMATFVTGAITSPSGYTKEAQETDSNNSQAGEADDKILTTTGTQSATWGLASSDKWVAALATLVGTAGGGGGTGPVAVITRKLQAVHRSNYY